MRGAASATNPVRSAALQKPARRSHRGGTTAAPREATFGGYPITGVVLDEAVCDDWPQRDFDPIRMHDKEQTVPYFVYKIQPLLRLLEKVDAHDTFKAASEQAKMLRRETPPGDACRVKVIHADNELLAEDLLSQVRDTQPFTGDDA